MKYLPFYILQSSRVFYRHQEKAIQHVVSLIYKGVFLKDTLLPNKLVKHELFAGCSLARGPAYTREGQHACIGETFLTAAVRLHCCQFDTFWVSVLPPLTCS